MTTFSSLPVEIQRQCVNYLDTAALKSMRLTSQDIKDIATEALFQVATLTFTEESAETLSTLIKNNEIRRYIRKLCLDTQYDRECMDGGDCYPSPPPKWWTEAVARWSHVTLPNLNEVMLDSAYTCANLHCTALELAFTTFLSGADIDTLTMKHLQDACQIQRPDIAQFSPKSKKLHILVTTWSDDCSESEIDEQHRHALFNVKLNTIWLTPMQNQLTHLTLHCNTFWGVYPRWQLDGLHFPRLKSLALGKWTVAFDWQIDFITSHSQTLEELILTRCPILHALRMIHRQSENTWQVPRGGTGRGKPPTNNFFSDLRWHAVLSEFRAKLTKLKHFSMGRGPRGERDWDLRAFSGDAAFEDRYHLSPRIDSSRYAIFDFDNGPTVWSEREDDVPFYKKDGWSHSSWMERETDEAVKEKLKYPDCLKEDRDALEELLQDLRSR